MWSELGGQILVVEHLSILHKVLGSVPGTGGDQLHTVQALGKNVLHTCPRATYMWVHVTRVWVAFLGDTELCIKLYFELLLQFLYL